MEDLAVACKQSSGTFTFPERDAVKRFVITKFWQQISNLKQQRDKELRMNNRNIEILIYLYQLWKNNTHVIKPETVEFTVNNFTMET